MSVDSRADSAILRNLLADVTAKEFKAHVVVPILERQGRDEAEKEGTIT